MALQIKHSYQLDVTINWKDKPNGLKEIESVERYFSYNGEEEYSDCIDAKKYYRSLEIPDVFRMVELFSMSTIYSNLAEYFTPARVKNAKTKPIERYFLHLNKTYCQGIFGNYNWSGFGITAKKESQPNIDVLNNDKTKFPTEEGVINQIHAIIAKERELKHQT